MRHSLPLVIALTLFLLAGCASPDPTGMTPPREEIPGEFLTESVVLVIIDGLRYSEGLGDPDGVFAPRMHELAAQGAIVEPFLNDQVTRTSRAIPAIWTGNWSDPTLVDDASCTDGSTLQASAPTVFEYYRKHLGRSQADCVYVLGEVGCPWLPSNSSGYGPDYWPRLVLEGATDEERWQVARQVLTEDHPRFLLLYLPDVDHAGHGGDWTAYVEAAGAADAIVGRLWDVLEADPFYAETTTLMVTNDHGRHDNRAEREHGGFSGHGDGCHGCRTIQFLMVGPDTRRGYVSSQSRAIPDIAPTVGLLLGFPTEQATGDAMVEILLDRETR